MHSFFGDPAQCQTENRRRTNDCINLLSGRIDRMQRRVDAVYTYTLGQLSLAFPRGRLIEYQLRLG